MTATDPRPALATAPAAEALAAAYAQDANPEPPPPDDRARAECHRAGRAQLAHLRELLAVLDWSAAHMPEPAPAPELEEEPWEPPPPAVPDYDGSEDEFHYCGEVYAGSKGTLEFRVWLDDMERRFGPVPMDDDCEGGPIECNVSGRKVVGRLATPEFRAWRARQRRRTEDSLDRYLDSAKNGCPSA